MKGMISMTVSTKGGYFSPEEINAYVKHIQEKYPYCEITELMIELDDEDATFVKLNYRMINKEKANVPFTRIRRISGYLGDMHRINNAKQHEIADRVKHDKQLIQPGETFKT